MWFWHAGAPLTLSIAEDGVTRNITLGADLTAGVEAHAIVPAHAWQAAESTGAWSLVSCVVAPGFEFSSFTLAPAGWAP